MKCLHFNALPTDYKRISQQIHTIIVRMLIHFNCETIGYWDRSTNQHLKLFITKARFSSAPFHIEKQQRHSHGVRTYSLTQYNYIVAFAIDTLT